MPLREATVLSEPSISALSRIEEIPRELIEVLYAMNTDIATLKNSLYGIRRDENNNLIINNKPFRNKEGNQKVLEITKDGIFNLGQQYGVRPDVIGNVKGSFYAVPQWCRFNHTVTQAGTGDYVWDTVLFNNTYDLYQRTTGNTRIRIIVPGDYHVSANVVLTNLAALGAGQFAFATLKLNNIGFKVWAMNTTAAIPMSELAITLTGMVQTTVDTDYISVGISSSGNVVGRFGFFQYSTLDICKVN